MADIDTTTGEVVADRKVVRVPKGVFAIASICEQADEPTPRTGVLVTRTKGGAMAATATDGRRLIRVTWPDEYMLPDVDASCIVPALAAAKAEREVPKKSLNPDALFAGLVMSDADTPIELHIIRDTGPMTLGADKIKGEFDDVQPLLATQPDGVTVTVGLALLAELLDTMLKVGADTVDLYVPNKSGKPIRLFADADGKQIEALQMPRTEAKE